MTDTRFEGMKEALEKERDALDKQLADHGVAPEGGIEVDVDEGFADTAHATAGKGEILAFVEQATSMRAEVEAALIRLEEGTYGTCESCGKEIGKERLEAVPWTAFCVSCKQQQS